MDGCIRELEDEKVWVTASAILCWLSKTLALTFHGRKGLHVVSRISEDSNPDSEYDSDPEIQTIPKFYLRNFGYPITKCLEEARESEVRKRKPLL